LERLTLYLDPWTGVSGDMLLAALLDLDREGDRLEAALRTAIAGLGLDQDLVEVAREVEWGVACTRVRVHADRTAPLRHLTEMERLLAEATLSDEVRAHALGAIRMLAEVEAAIHGCGAEEIHFHEVGAVDTLVDVVGTFTLLEALGVETVFVGMIPVGGGTVEIAHGRMGVPAPATARLLEGYTVVGGPEMVELTTPTGALLIRRMAAPQGPLPCMTVQKTGYGAGSRKLEHGPNLLRVLVGAAEGHPNGDVIVELQTNLDDVSPEITAHTMTAARQAGAVDVWSVPAFMKKNRPGVVVHALVDPGHEDEVASALFRESGTLGLRRYPVSRRLAARGTVAVEVGGEHVSVKWGRWQGRLVSVAAEYEDAARAAEATGLSVKDVMALAGARARAELEADGAD